MRYASPTRPYNNGEIMSNLEKMEAFYEEGNLPWDRELPPPELIESMEMLKPGRALDLGTGFGRSARYMAARGWTVDAIDFVQVAIDAAAERSAEFPTITYHCGSVTNLAHLNPPYDFAVDIGCGHSIHGADLVAYRDELARLLRPGGTFLLFGKLNDEDSDVDADSAEGKPSGFDEQKLLALFESSFTLPRVEHGLTEVRDASWRSAWFWFERK